MTRRRVLRLALAALTAAALPGTALLASGTASAATDAAANPSAAWAVTWTSQPAPGITSGGDGYLPAISGNGRVVTFSSDFKLSGDGTFYRDGMRSFVRRSGSPAPQRLAVLPGGKLGNAGDPQGCACRAASALSDDGHLAAFVSSSSNLTPGDTNAADDVFLRNLTTGAVTLVSHAPDGSPGNGPSTKPQMSRDGRWVLFDSGATNIDPAPGPPQDMYLHDTRTGVSHRVPGTIDFEQASSVLAGNGSTIAYNKFNEHNLSDVYVRDLATGAISMVSVSKVGTPTFGTSPSISDDASTVAYLSEDRHPKVVVTDVHTHRSVKMPLPAGERAYHVQISGDGNRLAIERSSGFTGVLEVVDLSGSVLYRAQVRPSSYTHFALDRDGSCLAYRTETADVPGDTNGQFDVYTACEG